MVKFVSTNQRLSYTCSRVLREYANVSVSPPHFTTKVLLGFKIHVTPLVISQVTQIPIVPNPDYRFPTPDRPNHTETQVRFNPEARLLLLEHEKVVYSSSFSTYATSCSHTNAKCLSH